MDSELKDKKGSEYDDDWQHQLSDLEEQFAAPSATSENLPDKHPHKKALDREDLEAKENSSADTASGAGEEAADDSIPYREEKVGRIRKLLGRKEREQKQRSPLQKLGKRAAIGGGLGAFVTIILLLIFLSSLKAVHFSEIMSAAGYARFRGVLVERTTQDIFDASVVRGDGEVSLRGRSIIDRIKMRNVENQLSAMGREGNLRFFFSEGSMDGVQIGKQTITLDGLTREAGFGQSFSDIRGGITNRLNPESYRKVARVRQMFYERVGNAMNETAGFDARYVRNGLFKRISDNVGFKWSKWRNGARDFLGKTPGEALIEEKVENTEKVSGDNSITPTDIEQIDLNQKAIKNGEKLKKYLEKHGGQFNMEDYVQGVQEDLGTAAKISDVAADVSMALLVLSLACMANQAFSRIPEIANKAEDAAVRQGLQFQALSSQIKPGKVTAQAVSSYGKSLDGAERTSAYAYATGQEVRGATDVPAIKPKVDPAVVSLVQKLTSPTTWATGGLSGLLGSVFPGIDSLTKNIDDTFCSTVLSPEGAISIAAADIAVQAIASFFTAGGAEVAEQGAGRAAASIFIRELAASFFSTAKSLVSVKGLATLGAIGLYSVGLEIVVNSLAGVGFFGAENGQGNFERGAAGTSVLQDRQLRSIGGRPLTRAEAQQVDGHYRKLAIKNWQEKGVMTRYFGRENPYSLVGLMAAKTPSSFASVGSILSSLVTHIGQVFQPSTFRQAFGSVFASLGGNKAYAATDPDFDPYYGMTPWGFSQDELDKMRGDASFSIAHIDEYLTQVQIDELDKTIGKCFSPEISQYTVESDDKYKTDCSRDKLSGDDALRYRLYKYADNYIAEDLSQDYQALLGGAQ